MNEYFETYQNLLNQIESYLKNFMDTTVTTIVKINEKFDEKFDAGAQYILQLLLIFLFLSIVVYLIIDVILYLIATDPTTKKIVIQEKLKNDKKMELLISINKKMDKILELLQEDIHIELEEYNCEFINTNKRKRANCGHKKCPEICKWPKKSKV